MTNAACQLYLTCANAAEATEIANTLLVKQLIVCAKQLPVKADYRWQGKLAAAEEILLIMDSRLDLFDEVEKVVAKLHSYETFVLQAVPIGRLSTAANRWYMKELT